MNRDGALLPPGICDLLDGVAFRVRRPAPDGNGEGENIVAAGVTRVDTSSTRLVAAES